MIDQDALIRRSFDLEPLPPTVARLATLVADAETDMAEIVNVLSMDPTLAGGVLRLANTPRYGARGEVGTVSDAVIRVGAAATLEMATRASVQKMFARDLSAYGLTESMIWSHSWGSSLAAETARNRHCRATTPAEATTAALLHDIGKLAIAQFLKPDVLRIMRDARGQASLSAAKAEREVLGVDHAEIGGLIVQHWNLPESMRLGITTHHDPGEGGNPIADLIHVADLAALAAYAAPAAGDACQPNDGVLERLSMDDQDFDELCTAVGEEFEREGVTRERP